MTKVEFADLTKSLFITLNQPAPDKDLLRDWYAKLNHLQLNILETAYDAIIDHQATPTLDNVLSFVKPPEKPPVDDEKPQYQLNRHDKDRNWARIILNNPKGRPEIAIKNAKIALNIR